MQKIQNSCSVEEGRAFVPGFGLNLLEAATITVIFLINILFKIDPHNKLHYYSRL